MNTVGDLFDTLSKLGASNFSTDDLERWIKEVHPSLGPVIPLDQVALTLFASLATFSKPGDDVGAVARIAWEGASEFYAAEHWFKSTLYPAKYGVPFPGYEDVPPQQEQPVFINDPGGEVGL